MNSKIFALALAALAAIPPTTRADSGTSGLTITDAWARRAVMLPGSGAATGTSAIYGTVRNTGKLADALVAAETDVAGIVEIHETYQESGMSMMRPLERIDLPAGASIALKPGGFHIMLIGLKRDLKPGQEVRLRLRFANGASVPAVATIR